MMCDACYGTRHVSQVTSRTMLLTPHTSPPPLTPLTSHLPPPPSHLPPFSLSSLYSRHAALRLSGAADNSTLVAQVYASANDAYLQAEVCSRRLASAVVIVGLHGVRCSV